MRILLSLILLIGLAAPKANAAPTITTISPTSVTAGAAGFTLSVNGTGFISGSAVQWNGVALQTTLVSATQMTALVSSSLVATQGTANITVFSPGGSQSNAVAFTINPQATGQLIILTASPLPNGAVGVPYSQALSATGGTTPYKGWAVAAGNLPPGISLTALGSFLKEIGNCKRQVAP